MKNISIKIRTLILLVFLLSLCSYRLQADEIKVGEGETVFTVEQNTFSNLQFSSSFSVLTYFNVKTEKGSFVELAVPEYGYSERIGDPKLPVLKKLIEVPQGAIVSIKVISYNMKEYKLADFGITGKIIPAQPSVSKDLKRKLPPFEYNTTTYNTDSFNTDELVSAEISGIMRSVRLARLCVAPVKYNPVTNTIRVYSDIKAEITFPGADVAQTNELKKNTYSMYFESTFSNQVMNYKKDDNAKDILTQYPVKFVIVSAPAFKTALQPFIQWKTKKGFYVVEAYTDNPAVGNSTTSIKHYLDSLYHSATPSDPAFSFVLFVGDVAQIPAFFEVDANNVSYATDLYYCEYTNDYFPEVYYGRFSANNLTELQPQINKTLEYEQYLMPDPSFLSNVVMVAGQDGSYGPKHADWQIQYGTSNYFNATHSLNSYTYLYSVSAGSAGAVIQNVSDGVCFANYTAHGSASGWSNPSFSINDIAGLQNEHKYPLMVGNCCQTSTYNGYCFAEELLRADKKGALGYIGGSNNTFWDEDYWWSVGCKMITSGQGYNPGSLGAYDRTFHDHGEATSDWFASQGQMIFAGNLAVTQAGKTNTKYYWEVYCLMGDPSLMIYYGVPPPLTAIYSPLLPLGAPIFTVNTEPYAYVGISMNGILYGAALADAQGVADVPVSPFPAAGIADVVVTKQNRAPYINTVTVNNPSGPYVIYTGKNIKDIAGNNNSKADYGEPVTLDITLKNLGASVANNVTAILTTTDTFVTITDNTDSWGNIASGIASTKLNAYSFTVDGFIPDQHSVLFTMYISDGSGNSWTGSFTVILNAPVLKQGGITVLDPLPAGNGNGRLDQGETVNIIVASDNIGHANADNAVSTLALLSGSVNILSGTDTIGLLTGPGGSKNAVFTVYIEPSAVTGSFATFNNTLSSGFYSVQKQISLQIGLVDEDWETGSFLKFPWSVQSSAIPWSITSVAPFEGVYCARSGVISNDDTSSLKITFDVISDDSISFYLKTASEEGYDFLKFYIDGAEKGAWSDSTGWLRAAFPVTAGTHTFMWSYEKDYSMNAFSDCAWIDYILFPPVDLNVLLDEIRGKGNSMTCYPNPFLSSACIDYNLETAGEISLKIYNSTGQEAAILINRENKQAGNYSVNFKAGNLCPGIYHCILSTVSSTIVRKLIIAR